MFSVQRVVRATKADMNFNDKKNQYNRLPVGYVPRDKHGAKDTEKRFSSVLDSILEGSAKGDGKTPRH